MPLHQEPPCNIWAGVYGVAAEHHWTSPMFRAQALACDNVPPNFYKIWHSITGWQYRGSIMTFCPNGDLPSRALRLKCWRRPQARLRRGNGRNDLVRSGKLNWGLRTSVNEIPNINRPAWPQRNATGQHNQRRACDGDGTDSECLFAFHAVAMGPAVAGQWRPT